MKAGKIFWGIILVYLGILVLLNNFDIIDFSWRIFWKFWPVLLIIWGINILISKENTRKGAVLIGLVTCLGLGLLTYFGIREKSNRSEYTWEERQNEDYGSDYTQDDRIFREDYSPNIKTGKISISGGAGEFEVKSPTDNLMEAHVSKGNINYVLKRTDTDSSVNLNFHAKYEKGIKLPTKGVHDTKIFLNNNPVWDIDVKVGAADVNLDLSPYKIKNLSFSGGATDVEIKLGSLYEHQNIVVETGVSSVEIKVPKSAGCKIINQSGLSSKKFQDFIEKESGVYETNNYVAADKKIDILLKTGISDLKVKTYQD